MHNKQPRWRRGLGSLRRTPEIGSAWLHSQTFWPLLTAYLRIGKTDYPLRYVSRGGSVIQMNDWWDATTIWAIFARTEYEVRPSDRVIFDLGANIGVFAIFATEKSPQAQVYCFEPFPTTFQRLQQTIQENDLGSRATAFNGAIALASGEAAMSGEPKASVCRRVGLNVSENEGSIRVQSWSLADAIAKTQVGSIDLVKMDIEGHETNVLLDAADDTLRYIKRLAVEIHQQEDVAPIIERMEKAGFRLTRRAGHHLEMTLTFERNHGIEAH